MRKLCVAVVTILTFVPLASLDAQKAAEEEVLETVRSLFEAMRTRDTTLIRSLFEPGARLVGTFMREGEPTMQAISIDQFVQAIGGAQADEEFIERIYNPKVEVSDNLASVWTWYTFHLGDRLSHCGVDAFQLARTSSGWKIVALADTRRMQGCEEVPKR